MFTPSAVCAAGTNPSCGFCSQYPGQCTPSNAIDGDATTRYTSGKTQSGDENFVIDFGATISITGITVDSTGSPKDYMLAYKVEYSTDGTTFQAFSTPVMGTGMLVTAITFPKTSMRAIKVYQTGMQPTGVTSWWSIHEITVQGCTSP